MENGKATDNAEQVYEDTESEAEKFDVFVNAMVRIVEKYGRLVLQDLDCVA